MIKEFFKIGGVKNEKEFLAKYPTEASFFRQHPEAMQMVTMARPFTPSYGEITMPQAMYGMGMAYGGYVPQAANGMQVGGPPKQEDYPDYETFSQAMDEYLQSLQSQADMGQAVPQGVINTAPVGAPSPYVPTLKSSALKDYKGVSIVDFLTAQGKPADFASRKQLAASLGISNYRGTATQNTQMLMMLQQAPDVLDNYKGIMQPTAGVTKSASRAKNAKGAPSTEEIARAKQEALTAPTSTEVNSSLKSTAYSNPFNFDRSNNILHRSILTGALQGVQDVSGPTVEDARRMQLAKQLNDAEAAGQSMFKQGYAIGGSWNGTWNGNQGFEVGGSYLPDYASSAYGLPQFELGSPMYADGGMSPDQAMMAQQQTPAPQFDQQQLMQAIFQMMQQGMAPDQIMQQLAQQGVPPQIAQQLIQIVMQQAQGATEQPNGAQQPMAPATPDQGMEGMQMPGGMARGGMVPGWEGEVSMDELEELRKKGVKFEII